MESIMAKSGNWTITIPGGGRHTPTSSTAEVTLWCDYDLQLPQPRVKTTYPTGARQGRRHEVPDISGTLTLGPFPPTEMERLGHFSGKRCRAAGPEQVILDWDVAICDAPREQGKFCLTGNFLKFQ